MGAEEIGAWSLVVGCWTELGAGGTAPSRNCGRRRTWAHVAAQGRTTAHIFSVNVRSRAVLVRSRAAAVRSRAVPVRFEGRKWRAWKRRPPGLKFRIAEMREMNIGEHEATAEGWRLKG